MSDGDGKKSALPTASKRRMVAPKAKSEIEANEEEQKGLVQESVSPIGKVLGEVVKNSGIVQRAKINKDASIATAQANQYDALAGREESHAGFRRAKAENQVAALEEANAEQLTQEDFAARYAINLRQKELEMAKLQADIAEQKRRQAQAEYTPPQKKTSEELAREREEREAKEAGDRKSAIFESFEHGAYGKFTQEVEKWIKEYLDGKGISHETECSAEVQRRFAEARKHAQVQDHEAQRK